MRNPKLLLTAILAGVAGLTLSVSLLARPDHAQSAADTRLPACCVSQEACC